MSDVILIACPRCARNNNIARTNCIYCGAPLPVPEGRELEKLPTLRPLEETEMGYNIVLFPGDSLLDDAARTEIETVTKLPPEHIDLLCEQSLVVPIARVAERRDADIIRRRLLAAGVRTAVLGDEDLAVRRLPRRVRRIVPDEGAVHLWSAEQVPVQTFAWTDIDLIVFGVLRTREVQTREENPRIGVAKRELTEASERYTELDVIDLFAGDVARHFRISAESFDYSCLGARKRLLAAENFRELGVWLVERAATAAVIERHRRLYQLLDPVWPATRHTDRLAVKRTGIVRYASEARTLINNELQFTRFARTSFLIRRGLGAPE